LNALSEIVLKQWWSEISKIQEFWAEVVTLYFVSQSFEFNQWFTKNQQNAIKWLESCTSHKTVIIIIIITTLQNFFENKAITLYFINSGLRFNFYGTYHMLCPCLSSEQKHKPSMVRHSSNFSVCAMSHFFKRITV
jgi:hypothetical protein